MNIVEKIKNLQKQKIGKVSLNALEIELGFGKSVISSWQTKKPNSDYLITVADYFDVSVDYLLGRDKPLTGLSKKEENLISCFRAVDSAAQDVIFRVAENEYRLSLQSDKVDDFEEMIFRQNQDFQAENQALQE